MVTRISLVLLALSGLAAPARGQTPYETVGSRALGMAGAFVAVADDVTAAYWNPAALATGPVLGTTIEWSRFQKRDPNGPPVHGAGLDTGFFTGVGGLPLAITFGRLTSVNIVDGPTGGRSVERLSTSQFGGTILQTIGQGLIVGATLKYVRGTLAGGPVGGSGSAGDIIDASRDLQGRSEGAFDIDLGVLADFDRLRLGVACRNLLEPEFHSLAGTAITVPRMVRFGLAVRPGAGVTLAMDLDLDTVDLRAGLRRMIALGAEAPIGSRFALRGGARWDLEGDREPVAAAGASLGITERLWLDGHYSYGSDRDQGFGFALRGTY